MPHAFFFYRWADVHRFSQQCKFGGKSMYVMDDTEDASWCEQHMKCLPCSPQRGKAKVLPVPSESVFLPTNTIFATFFFFPPPHTSGGIPGPNYLLFWPCIWSAKCPLSQTIIITLWRSRPFLSLSSLFVEALSRGHGWNSAAPSPSCVLPLCPSSPGLSHMAFSATMTNCVCVDWSSSPPHSAHRKKEIQVL